MEQNNFQPQEVEPTNQFKQVTPLSKYLAMVLFIALPFIGGYVGYQFAPVEVVEVEKYVVKNADTETMRDASDAEQIAQTSESSDTKDFAFASYNQEGWRGAWLVARSEMNEWQKVQQVANAYIVDDGILHNSATYLNVRGDVTQPDQKWKTAVVKVDLLSSDIESVRMDGYVTNLLSSDGQILVFELNEGTCVDSPHSITTNENCAGTLYTLALQEPLSLSVLASDMPAAKRLVAYNPASSVVVLWEGYGDAGCVWDRYYEYNLENKELHQIFNSSGCADDGEQNLKNHQSDHEAFLTQLSEKYPYSINGKEGFQSVKITGGSIVPSGNVEDEDEMYFTELIMN